MNTDKIEKAKAVVGENHDDDYILKPEMHAALFSDKAPELGRVLRSAELEGVASNYAAYDRAAIAAQDKFKAYSGRARLWVFLTACCSALLLAVATLFGQPDQATLSKWLFILLSIAAFVSSFLATTHIKLVENMKLLEKWMKSRANAEMQRLDYFSRFISSKLRDAASADPVLVCLMKLEFFRRFQLDMQVSYYTQRSQEHAAVAEETATISTWAMGGAGLAAAIAGFLGSSVDTRLAAIAGIGFIFQAYASNILSREAINQDRRNEERYGRTTDILKNLRMRLDKVREQVAAGNQTVLGKYVEAVHEQLSLEHRQWTDDVEMASKAMVELKAQLKESEPGARSEDERQ